MITTLYSGTARRPRHVAPASQAVTGLDFPGVTNGLYSPMAGWRTALGTVAPFARSPATYIWQVTPRAQGSNYHVHVCRAQWLDIWDGGETYRYHLGNPYNNGFWEIAAHGATSFDTLGDAVAFGEQVTCVFIVNGLSYTFYYDFARNQSKVITVTEQNSTDPTDAWLSTPGSDAPWNRGLEIGDGIFRGFQYYDAAFSITQAENELVTPGSVRTPWYYRPNPTPGAVGSDASGIADESGNNNHPVWLESWDRPGEYDKPTLYSA